jgi:hypothetical protein
VVQRSLVAVSCLAVLSLAGCTDGGSSSADPPTATPTVSSGTVAPSAAAERETPEAFVRRWVRLNTDMQNSGRTERFEAACPESGSCRQLVRLVRSYYDAGGYLKTGRWTVLFVHELGHRGSRIQVATDIRSAPTEFKRSAGSPVEHFDGGVTHNQLVLHPSATGWLIEEWTQEA